MKRSSTLFLKATIVGLAILALIVCVVAIPRIINEFTVGGYDPILVGLYAAAVPFFVALFFAMKLLGYIDRNQAFSTSSIKALKGIKYCAVIIAGLFAFGMPYIYYVANEDDAPGVIVLGLVMVFAPLVVATFAGVLQKLVQNAVDIKSENDLTV